MMQKHTVHFLTREPRQRLREQRGTFTCLRPCIVEIVGALSKSAASAACCSTTTVACEYENSGPSNSGNTHWPRANAGSFPDPVKPCASTCLGLSASSMFPSSAIPRLGEYVEGFVSRCKAEGLARSTSS